jgi:chemosensory pili system protein ChpE
MELFLLGFGLGLAICASPGAVTTQAVRTGIERGFGAALSLQVGALVGMALWSGIGLIGATLLTENLTVRVILSITGVALLLYLSGGALRDAIQDSPQEGVHSGARGDFTVGALLSLANPLPLALWLGVGSSTAISPNASQISIFFVGLLSSAMLWSVALAGVTAWGRRFVTPALFRIVSFVCGLALAGFAVRLAWNVIQLLRH